MSEALSYFGLMVISRKNIKMYVICMQVIWPYNAGEVIVQNYNAVLSLAHLYQSADAVIALENDSLNAICSRLLAIPKVSFNDLNRVIARQLACILTPVSDGNGRTLKRNHVGELIIGFCCV